MDQLFSKSKLPKLFRDGAIPINRKFSVLKNKMRIPESNRQNMLTDDCLAINLCTQSSELSPIETATG